MIKSYIRIAWRNLVKNKKTSFINIAGLALGMVVFMFIALWVWNELTYDKYHKNYDRIGQIVQTQTYNGEQYSNVAVPFPLGDELKNQYGENFKYVVMASWPGQHVLSRMNTPFSENGMFMDVDAPEMLSLTILKGNIRGLDNPNSIMLAESTAAAIFGDEDPLEQVIKINQQLDVKVRPFIAIFPTTPRFTTSNLSHHGSFMSFLKIGLTTSEPAGKATLFSFLSSSGTGYLSKPLTAISSIPNSDVSQTRTKNSIPGSPFSR